MGPPEPSSSGRNRSKRSAQQNQIGAEPHDASNSQNVRRRLLTDYVNIAGAKAETVEQCLSTKDGQTRFIHSQGVWCCIRSYFRSGSLATGISVLWVSRYSKFLPKADVSEPNVNGHAKPEVVVDAASQDVCLDDRVDTLIIWKF
ncbi:hypothetical protein Tco_1564441 [Tanacetum coccineum]